MISLKDQIKSLFVYNGELCLLNIRVTPKAASNRIKIDIGIVRVYITTAPEDNKANQAVIKLIAEELAIAPSKISVIKGMKSKNKILAIQHYKD